MSTLHILMVCKSLPWNFNGGIQSHTWELSKALADQKHKVTVLTAGSIYNKEVRYVKDAVEIIEIRYLPGRYLKPFHVAAEEIFFNLAVRKWLFKNQHNYSIIHLQGRSGMFFTSDSSAKIVTTIHGLIDVENAVERKSIGSLIYRKVASRLERLNISKANALITVSQELNRLVGVNENTIVIPNGVNPVEQKASQNKDRRLLFVGRIHPIKGYDTLLHALALTSSSIHLDIVGDGPMYRDMTNLIAQLGLEKRVRLHGNVPQEQVFNFMQTAFALILPSVFEGQGLVLLEANLYGIPVIASDIPSIKEVVEHGENGLLCSPNEPSEFAEAITKLFKNTELAHSIGQTGHRKVLEGYTWQQIANKTVEVYHKTLAA